MGLSNIGRKAIDQQEEQHEEHMNELKKQDTKIKIVIGITIASLIISIISLF